MSGDLLRENFEIWDLQNTGNAMKFPIPIIVAFSKGNPKLSVIFTSFAMDRLVAG